MSHTAGQVDVHRKGKSDELNCAKLSYIADNKCHCLRFHACPKLWQSRQCQPNDGPTPIWSLPTQMRLHSWTQHWQTIVIILFFSYTILDYLNGNGAYLPTRLDIKYYQILFSIFYIFDIDRYGLQFLSLRLVYF